MYEKQDLNESPGARRAGRGWDPQVPGELAGAGTAGWAPSWLCVPGEAGSRFSHVQVGLKQGRFDDEKKRYTQSCAIKYKIIFIY